MTQESTPRNPQVQIKGAIQAGTGIPSEKFNEVPDDGVDITSVPKVPLTADYGGGPRMADVSASSGEGTYSSWDKVPTVDHALHLLNTGNPAMQVGPDSPSHADLKAAEAAASDKGAHGFPTKAHLGPVR